MDCTTPQRDGTGTAVVYTLTSSRLRREGWGGEVKGDSHCNPGGPPNMSTKLSSLGEEGSGGGGGGEQ